MNQFVIYRAEYDNCAVMFPIIYIINKQFVLIGPEFKKGIQPAITYKEFNKRIDKIEGGKCEFEDIDGKCLDLWEALNDNFYFSNIDLSIKKILSVYFSIARQTDTLDLIPSPILGLMDHENSGFDQLYVAKCIDVDLSKVVLSDSRDVYFSSLTGNPNVIVTEKDFSFSCLISKYEPGVLSKTKIKKDTLKKFVLNVELCAKVYGFIHGKPHVGHVTQDGQYIDYGHAFNLREKDRVIEYIKRVFPKTLQDKAIERAKIHDVDVGVLCTLTEISQFLISVSDPIERKKEMLEWIIKVLNEYFERDESIFTYLKNSNFVFGGYIPEFGLPEPFVQIKEEFPTYYFGKLFL